MTLIHSSSELTLKHVSHDWWWWGSWQNVLGGVLCNNVVWRSRPLTTSPADNEKDYIWAWSGMPVKVETWTWGKTWVYSSNWNRTLYPKTRAPNKAVTLCWEPRRQRELRGGQTENQQTLRRRKTATDSEGIECQQFQTARSRCLLLSEIDELLLIWRSRSLTLGLSTITDKQGKAEAMNCTNVALELCDLT